MTTATPLRPEARVVLRDLPAEHLEELAFLLPRRAAAVRSHTEFEGHLAALDARIDASLLGLAVVPRHARAALEEALADGDAALLSAATRGALRLGDAAAWALVEGALDAAPPDGIRAMSEALVEAPGHEVRGRLVALGARAAKAAPAAAASLAHVLAAHGGTPPAPATLAAWCAHEDPGVRRSAALAAAHGNVAPAALQGLAEADPEAAVREVALFAGLWTRTPWVTALVNRILADPAIAPAGCVSLAAAVADASSAARLRAHVANPALDAGRYHWLADAGWGGLVSIACEGMVDKNAAVATTAAESFARMTGVTTPAVRVDSPVDGTTEPVYAPNPLRARAHLDAEGARYLASERWAQGRALGTGSAPAEVDLGARWFALLRARHAGAGTGMRELLRLS